MLHLKQTMLTKTITTICTLKAVAMVSTRMVDLRSSIKILRASVVWNSGCLRTLGHLFWVDKAATISV